MNNYLNKGNEMNSGKMEMDGFVLGKKVSVSMVATLNASLALLRSRSCCSIFVLTMNVLFASQTAQAQPPRQKPPELTLNQAIEFCEPQIKAADEIKLIDLAEQAAWQRSQAPKAWVPSHKLENAKNDDERAADLRARGYQSKESTGAWYLKGINELTSAKDVRADILSWKDTLKRVRSGQLSSEAGLGPGAPTVLCMLELRLAQIQGKALGGGTVKQSRVSMAPGQDPSLGEGGGGPNPPAPAPQPPANKSPGLGVGMVGVPISKLTSAQVAACSDEIRRTQLASQSWGGDVNQVAARLGQFQKDLFEGRCAGHPEAQAYIAGAIKMLSYSQPAEGGPGAGAGTITGGNPGASSGASSGGPSGGSSGSPSDNLSPLARGGISKEHNPAHEALKCVTILHEDEMKARGYKSIMRSLILNTCPYPISVLWCIEAGKGDPGDCNPGYSNLVDLRAKGSYGIGSNSQGVRYAACRKGPNMGFQAIEKDPRNPFRFSCS